MPLAGQTTVLRHARAQEGTDNEDQLNAAAMGDDGSVVLAGFTRGGWSMQLETTWRTHLAAAKLDADGVLLWKWQVGR